MSLQGITLAVSPSGISYFANVLLANQIATALQGLTPPDKNIPVADITLSSTKAGITSDININVALSQGKMVSFTPTFQSISQSSGGEFTMTLQASNCSVSYNWNETYQTQFCGLLGCNTINSSNKNYAYSMGIGTLTLAVVFQFSYANSAWTFTLVSATPTTSNLSPNIPSQSIVNSEESSGCFSTSVSSVTLAAIKSIDFSTPINALLQPLFGSIPSTGDLGSGITFNFPMGSAGLTFPGDAGLATGVTGDTTYTASGTSTEYPGTGLTQPTLSLPPVPTDHHLNYYASDYTFNALFWAFYQAGLLAATATPGNIPNPAALNTSSFNNTQLQALYNAYPDTPMTAVITPQVPPTVTFEQIYDLTQASVNSLQSSLPAAVYGLLKFMIGQVYFDSTSFAAALVNALGSSNAALYQSTIEGVAQVVGAVVTHNNDVVMNVVSQGNTIEALKFNVVETDVLQNFVLGISGTTQTLQFDFQMVPTLTTATFISSPLPSVNSGDFGSIWNWAIQNVYANQVQAMGKAGVALPRIPGFNFLFDNAIVTLETGYANVLTDVQHSVDNGTMYLMSKRLIQHGEPIVPISRPKRQLRLRTAGV